MKRIMANFIGTNAGKPQHQHQHQPKSDPVGTGIAFVSPKKKTFPECHVCGKQHKGGYVKCRTITDKTRRQIDKLVNARAFDNKSGSSGIKPTATRTAGTRKPTYKKQGAANAVVGYKPT